MRKLLPIVLLGRKYPSLRANKLRKRLRKMTKMMIRKVNRQLREKISNLFNNRLFKSTKHSSTMNHNSRPQKTKLN